MIDVVPGEMAVLGQASKAMAAAKGRLLVLAHGDSVSVNRKISQMAKSSASRAMVPKQMTDARPVNWKSRPVCLPKMRPGDTATQEMSMEADVCWMA